MKGALAELILTILSCLLGRFSFWLRILKYGSVIIFKTQLGYNFFIGYRHFDYSIRPPLASSSKVYVSGVAYFKNV